MIPSRKPPSVAFWATVVVVVALVVYPLSIGPWCWVVVRGQIPYSLVWLDHIYDPLRWVIQRSPERVDEAVSDYLSLWRPAEPFEYHGE